MNSIETFIYYNYKKRLRGTKMKKAQGLSINTIIIVALALVVLVALIAIFTGRLGGFGRETMNCEGTYKGTCRDLVEDAFEKGCQEPEETKHSLGRCFKDDGTLSDQVCCVRTYEQKVDPGP